MSYTTKQGQTIFDVMIQNKGSLTGLIEFIGDLETVNDVFFSNEVLSIEKETNTITNFLDNKLLTVASVEQEVVLAPTNFNFTNPTTSTLQANWTDESDNETGFEVQISKLSDFSVIEQTISVDSGIEVGDVSGLDDGVLYYGRARALGAINSPYSNIDSATTASLFEAAALIIAPCIRLTANATVFCSIRRDSDNAVTDVLVDDVYEFISLNSIVSAGGTLGDWVGSNNGFIRTGYDQIGSKDYEQVSTAIQPQIITAGVIDLHNTKPSAQYSLSSGTFISNADSVSEVNQSNDFTIINVSHNDASGVSSGTHQFRDSVSTHNVSMLNSRKTSGGTYGGNIATTSGNQLMAMLAYRNTDEFRIVTLIHKQATPSASLRVNGGSDVTDFAYAGTWDVDSNRANQLGVSASPNITGGSELIILWGSDKSSEIVSLETKLAAIFGETYPS